MIKLLKELLGKLFNKYNELFFVGSTDKLPPPLSKEEEEIVTENKISLKIKVNYLKNISEYE